MIIAHPVQWMTCIRSRLAYNREGVHEHGSHACNVVMYVQTHLYSLGVVGEFAYGKLSVEL